MFHFPRLTPYLKGKVTEVRSVGFPHSEISGSKVATHLPEAYRSYTASFFATLCQGIHHTPLMHSLYRKCYQKLVIKILTTYYLKQVTCKQRYFFEIAKYIKYVVLLIYQASINSCKVTEKQKTASNSGACLSADRVL